MIMEELLIKRQISYSCIFPSGTDTLREILKIIPSKSAIAWASYMLTKKKMMSINQTEADSSAISNEQKIAAYYNQLLAIYIYQFF